MPVSRQCHSKVHNLGPKARLRVNADLVRANDATAYAHTVTLSTFMTANAAKPLPQAAKQNPNGMERNGCAAQRPSSHLPLQFQFSALRQSIPWYLSNRLSRLNPAFRMASDDPNSE